MKTTFFALLSALTLGALAAPSQIARRSCTYACPQGYVTGETQNGLLQCSSHPGVGIHGGIYTCQYSQTNGVIYTGTEENANCPLTAATTCD